MAIWSINVSGKGLRKASIEKLVKKLESELKEATVTITDASPPSSRADRYSHAQSQLGDAKSEFESLRDELQDWYDNLPEQFQEGDKGQQLQDAVDTLEEVISECENAEGHDVEFPGMYLQRNLI